MSLANIKDKAVELLKRAYGTTLVYRLVWTGISAAAGWASVQFGADPQWGFLIVLVTTAITSAARENLGDANFGAEADAKKAGKARKAE